MNTLRWLRLSVLCVLACSAAAAVDRYLAAATFCDVGSSCERVQQGQVGQLLAAALPAVGLVLYGVVFWGSLRDHWRRVALWLSVLGGVGGAGLLLYQWLYVGALCRLCVGADGFALVSAALGTLSLWRLQRSAGNGAPGPTAWPVPAWGALFTFAVLGPPAYAVSRPAPVPAFVQALQVPGKATVVEVSDFQCPHCRQLHASLKQAIATVADQVHFVRVPYPLPGHSYARGAALIYLCARAQGLGEAAAHLLFTTDLSQITAASAAASLGLPSKALQACVAAPHTEAELQRGIERVQQASVKGLPTVYIGDEALLGFDSAAGATPYKDAVGRVTAGAQSTYAPWPWLALGALMLALVSMSSRTKARRKPA